MTASLRTKLWQLKRHINLIRLDLILIFIFSFLTIFLIDLWLIDIPEYFKGGEKIGRIIYSLCFSYVTAFLFYYLVVHLKHRKDRNNLNEYISSNILAIIVQAKNMSNELAKASSINLNDKYPNKHNLSLICKSINPNSKAPLILGYIGNNATWLQYIDYFRINSNRASEKVLSKLQYLDSELVSKLSKIEECQLFKSIEFVNSIRMRINYKDFSSSEKDFYKYFELIKDLEKYYDQAFGN